MKRMPAMLTLMVATVIGLCAAMAEPITVTDLLGRQVTLEKPAKRIVLSQGRHLQALALLHPDPVSLIAGWKEDYTLDSASYAVWKEKFPQVSQIPSVGAATDLSFSVEKAIGLEPDLVVFGLFTSEATSAPMLQGITSSFEKAGIPVVFVDFFVKPMQNTLPSVDILGKLIGREEQAAAFTAFYSGKLKRIAERIGPETERPKVFMQVHAAPGDCCNSPGRGIFDDFIVAAGGHNIGADVIPGIAGRISVEHLITVDPDIYVATGPREPWPAGRFPADLGPLRGRERSHLRRVAPLQRLAHPYPADRGDGEVVPSGAVRRCRSRRDASRDERSLSGPSAGRNLLDRPAIGAASPASQPKAVMGFKTP
jgi:iron complex transport system substrate-binding protein